MKHAFAFAQEACFFYINNTKTMRTTNTALLCKLLGTSQMPCSVMIVSASDPEVKEVTVLDG
jgi:hypothetical protein